MLTSSVDLLEPAPTMPADVQGWLEDYERLLVAEPRRRLEATGDWAVKYPAEAGVYVIWDGATPIYVGESSSLALRMADIRRPVNHPFPKEICAEHGMGEDGLVALSRFMSSRYTVSCLRIPFGRREVEEYLVLRWRRHVLNKPALRLLRSPQYDWVTAL